MGDWRKEERRWAKKDTLKWEIGGKRSGGGPRNIGPTLKWEIVKKNEQEDKHGEVDQTQGRTA